MYANEPWVIQTLFILIRKSKQLFNYLDDNCINGKIKVAFRLGKSVFENGLGRTAGHNLLR